MAIGPILGMTNLWIKLSFTFLNVYTDVEESDEAVNLKVTALKSLCLVCKYILKICPTLSSFKVMRYYPQTCKIVAGNISYERQVLQLIHFIICFT